MYAAFPAAPAAAAGWSAPDAREPERKGRGGYHKRPFRATGKFRFPFRNRFAILPAVFAFATP